MIREPGNRLIRLHFHGGPPVIVAPQHIVSMRANDKAPGTIVRMVNGDQWAPHDDVTDMLIEWEAAL